MPTPSSSVDITVSETRWADQAASRLRVIMSICADESTEKRQASIEKEIRRQLEEVPSDKQRFYLDELATKFPTWQRLVATGDAAPTALITPVVQVETVGEMLLLLGRIAPNWSEPDRAQLRAKLTELQLIKPVDGEADEIGNRLKQQNVELEQERAELQQQNAELKRENTEFKQENAELRKQKSEVKQKLSPEPNKAVASDRLMRLCAQQEEFLVKLDQLVWNTWRILAPKSTLKRDASLGDFRTLIRHYLRGDAEPSDQQMAQQIERTRQLIAVLMGSMSQISRGFVKRYQTRYAPEAVKDLVKLEGGGRLLTSADTRYWRKYSELAAEITEAGIQSDMQEVVVRYVEELMRGAPRGNA